MTGTADAGQGPQARERSGPADSTRPRVAVAAVAALFVALAGTAGWATQAVLTEWRHGSLRTVAVLAVLGAVTLLLATLLGRELARRGRAEHAVRESDEKLRLLAERAAERQAQAEEMRRVNEKLELLARNLARSRDEAQRASRAKSRFLAGMSHELRTPLNGILGYAELLRLDGGLTPVQQDRVEAMLGAGRHLLEMINRVLDLSEVEAGHAGLQASTVEPAGIARNCLDLVRPPAEAKGLVLRCDAAPGTPRTITADPTRLRQVLLNLLGNAVKFTARGEVSLRLRPAAGGAALRIEVADTGPGIPADRRHRLFQDFERLDTDAGAIEGAGLGLALSARLAAAMGGRLGHEDPGGTGSVFWLELPVPESPGGTLIARPAVPAVPIPPSPPMDDARPALPGKRKLRLLVVDDVAMNRDVAASFLRSGGHVVTCVGSGADAVAAAVASAFDVVLMDVRMPGMDGLEATRRIRALDGPRGRVPVIALTAQAFAEQIAECRVAGMDDHLAKPYTPDALLAAVLRAAGPSAAAAADEAASAAEAPAGADLPVLDAAAFERTAGFLAPDAVATYLNALVERSELLLRRLRAPGAVAYAGAELATAAHDLAGSAGMLGFERLATVARSFERAVQAGTPDAEMLAGALCAAIRGSVIEMRARVPQPAVAEAA